MLSSLEPYTNYFFIAFGILIPALGYAIYLQWRTYDGLKQEKETQVERIKQAQVERQENLKESLRIISMATIQKQCEISEACLRLSNLVPHYNEIDDKEDQWKPLFEMYEEIKPLKTLDERKALKANQRFEEDKTRFALEEKYHDQILEVCEKIYEITKGKENG